MKGYGDNFKQRVIDSFKKEPEIQAQFTDIQIIVPKSHLLAPARHRAWWPGHPHYPHRRPHRGHVRDLDAQRAYALRRRRGLGGPAPVHGAGQLEGVARGAHLHSQASADQIVPGRGPVTGREGTERMSEYIRYIRARVRTMHRQGRTKQETVQTVLREVVGWFPITPALKSKTESQIKQGIGRIWNEMEKAAKLKDKGEPETEPDEPAGE
jgi:cyclase